MVAIAALLMEYGEPLSVTEITVLAPGPRDVRVRLSASGLCRSDLMAIDSVSTPLPFLPGHEGAGVVEEVGNDVTAVAPGDHVIISSVIQCGECFYCSSGRPVLCTTNPWTLRPSQISDPIAPNRSRYELDGSPVWRWDWSGTLCDTAVVPERAAIKIENAMPLDLASLIGCGVTTGVGAALNTADINPGDTVAVVGCGGVGLSIIQGARLAEAGRIVAVDVHDWKLELTEKFGATDVINSKAIDPVEAVREMTDGRGADVAFEGFASRATTQAVIDMTRPGGQCIFVALGIPELPTGFMLQEKIVRGSLFGSADVRRDFPLLVRLFLEGRLYLEEMVSRRLPLTEVNDAIHALREGDVARSLILFN